MCFSAKKLSKKREGKGKRCEKEPEKEELRKSGERRKRKTEKIKSGRKEKKGEKIKNKNGMRW